MKAAARKDRHDAGVGLVLPHLDERTELAVSEKAEADNPAYGAHEHHGEIAKRLKRAGGHLKSVVEMIETGRSCLDIAQQLHAVEKAIGQAKRVLIQDHLDHCLEATVGQMPKDQRRPIDEFKEITKYL